MLRYEGRGVLWDKHVCSACGGKMKLVKEGEDGYSDLTCPQCGEKLELVDMVLWD